ncbi:biotin--[acetyl-CoA-carboxylase] ligase [Paracoccus luteus]|uniref:biotin--[acetyl-CoA-carboxylase] ligase n=1 Tax=Paracoccus luteus TaxID=2508543 RepID=UPI00107029A8|nr:biotin--[acetyl-CoA-carboxylase] ligase [Paracoccus luteus]
MADPWPDGVARHVLARTDSTNAEALRMAATVTGPAWIMARAQTAGRGRRGRAWQMPPGNFAATLLTRPAGGPAQAALLSFVAALALHDALGLASGPAARLAIKWPNDVLLNGGKVAGILLESTGSAAGLEAVAVGIGVNLAAAPDAALLEPGAVPPVSVLGETGHAVTPEDFLDLLAPAFARWQAQLATLGFAPLRAAWTARAARLGQTITARMGTASQTGRFDGIDDSGALILATAAGRQVIPAADIHFPTGG